MPAKDDGLTMTSPPGRLPGGEVMAGLLRRGGHLGLRGLGQHGSLGQQVI